MVSVVSFAPTTFPPRTGRAAELRYTLKIAASTLVPSFCIRAFTLLAAKWSGQRVLQSRPPRPRRGALLLSYARSKVAGRTGAAPVTSAVTGQRSYC